MVYISFAEFDDLFGCSELWLPVAYLRSEKCREIDGGISAAFRILIETIFGCPGCLQEAGVMGKTTEGLDYIFFSEFGDIVGDDDMLTKSQDVRGASSLLPCQKCKNTLLTRILFSLIFGV